MTTLGLYSHQEQMGLKADVWLNLDQEVLDCGSCIAEQHEMSTWLVINRNKQLRLDLEACWQKSKDFFNRIEGKKPKNFNRFFVQAKVIRTRLIRNSNTVNSKFHFIRSFCEIFAWFLLFPV